MPPPDAAGLKIPCSSPQILQAELDALATVLEPPEREDTWEKMEKGIIRFTGVTRGGGYKHADLFVRGVGNKGVGLRIVDCMMSDRGRLSGVSTDLLQTMAPRLASHFGPLVHLYLPPLVRLLARPNKVFFKRSESHGLDDRSDQCKRAAAVGIESAMAQWDPRRWPDKDLDLLELCVRKMATDRDGEVRKTARRVWGLFSELWPERVEDFMTPLTPTIRRYLDIPADGAVSKPKPRLGLRPRLQAVQAEAGSSTRGAAAIPPPHGVSAPRTRSASRGFNAEQRHRVVSASVAEGSSGCLSRSASHNLLSHASSSSSLNKSESSRHHVLSKPSRPGHYVREAYRSSPSKQDLARAAAIPLPEDSPLVTKSSLPPTTVQFPESPSFAMLLSRQPGSNDVPEMPTLLDLSMADMTIIAPAGTPGPVPHAQLSQPLREVAPSPGSVAHLIGRFSSSPSETPSKSTPTRIGSSPLSGAESTPTSRSASKRSPLSAEPTGSSSSSPSQGTQRRISPLPRRSSTFIQSSGDEDSPNRSLKRKGSDMELSFTESSPVPRGYTAPRFSQPLIAFGDTPTRRHSLRPFVFGASNVDFFDDLMGIQSGDVEEDDIAHQGFIQPIEGLVIDTGESADLDVDLLLMSVSAVPQSALESRATGEAVDLLDLGDPSATIEGVLGSTDDNDLNVRTESESDAMDQTIIVATGGVSDSEADNTNTSVAFVNAEVCSTLSSSGADTDVVARVPATEVGALTVPPTPVQVSQARATHVSSTTPATKTELTFDTDALVHSMAATTLTSPARKLIDSQATTQAAMESIDFPSLRAASACAEPSPSKFDPGRMALKEATSVAATPDAKEPIQVEGRSETPPVVQFEDKSDETAKGAPLEKLQGESEKQPKENSDTSVQELIAFTAATSTTLKSAATSQSSGPEIAVSVPIEGKPTPSVDAPALPTVPQPLSTRARGHMRSTTAPMRPTNTSTRLGPPSRSGRPTPVEKKSFKPVSRLGLTDSGKSAPAPARLAMVTKASQAKAGADPAPTGMRRAPAAPVAKAPSAPNSKPLSRGPSRPASRQVSRAANPMPERDPSIFAQPTASNSTDSSKPCNPTAKPISNLFKPTVAATARVAATVLTKEKEPIKQVKPSHPPTAVSSRAPASRAASSRPPGGLSAPTAASRARAEAALPPSKRQRVKLKAPMESFKPGRGRPNPAKTAVLGQTSLRPRREIRTKKGSRVDKPETFPLPDPRMASLTSDMAVECAPTPTAEQPSKSPSIPSPQDETDVGILHTPTALSPLVHSAALSSASSRHTDRSYDSSRSSPRKMRPSPSRPLDPVLTPLHHALSGSSDTATPKLSGNDSPATAHTRRISGMSSNILRSVSMPQESSRGNEHDSVPEEAEGVDVEKEGAANVVRHDVSTPQGKASSLLAKLSAERRALTPRDGNKE
ncbi:hypothetical protein CspeluHIS016_0504710 [Cutaneotrichosporon spelunceum]|uniref:CLASP N-terminal domain-containing protein n=1 Tax=Cutaneotrichosporon spelunceum TaxID=1672016 RepID=A0AAD3TX54_9TREE|nr:hypothetical protein CspeluHIS016_0504710 [Cutaneotrichosporon spelunceum]